MTRVSVLFFCSSAMVSACGESKSIKLVLPDSLRADSATPITITAQLKFRGLNVADNTEAKFSADVGSFSATTATQTLVVRSVSGVAKADYYPPNTPQAVTVAVSFTNPNRENVSLTQVITLTGAPAVDANQISIGCDAGNIGALVSGARQIKLSCTVQAKDKGGNPLPGAEMYFGAEAGLLRDQGAASGSRKAFYIVDPGSQAPVDVAPTPIENEADGALSRHLVHDDGGKTYNPRDGLATLAVAVRAAEGFKDKNGNGRYDDDELFTDEGEPFIDVDDDGLFSIDAGDLFPSAFDTNKNGQWDPANGVHDESTLVARYAHVLWTGTPKIVIEGPRSFKPGGSANYSVFVSDQNGNPPPGFDTSDKVDINAGSKPSGVSINGLVQQPLSTAVGMTFTAAGAFLDFTRESATRYPIGRRFDIAVSDGRGTTAVNAKFSLQGTIRHTTGPRDQGHAPQTVTMSNLEVLIQP